MNGPILTLKNVLRPFLSERQKQVWRSVVFGSRAYIQPDNLSNLARLYGSDKWDKDHTFKGLSYLDVYEKYFSEFRQKPINLLEIGVLNGSSLRTWKRYFWKAHIFGLDIDPKCKQYEEERIAIEIGNQADETTMRSLFGSTQFDIIIDDGSHVNKHILKSYELLFSRLKSGGLYVIEDLGNSYLELEKIGGRKWPGMQYNQNEIDINNKRADMDEFFKKIIHDMDKHKGDVQFLHFWSYLAIIKKA